MTINNKFNIGDIVYLRTDTDNLKRIVLSMQILPGGAISYHLACGEKDGWHHEFEMSDERNGNIAGFKK